MKKLLLLCALGIAAAIPAKAQTYDIPCGAGTSVLGNGQTINPADGHLKAYLCVDGQGNVTSPQIGGAPANSPGIPSANGNVYYPTNYGAKFDALNLLTCSGSAHSLTCTGTGTNFIVTDVGKTVWESGNGPTVTPDLDTTTISAVNSTTNVSTTAAFTRTSTNGEAVYGTDDTAALNSVPILAPQNCNSSVHLAAGGTIFSAAIWSTLVPSSRCAYDQTTNMPTISGEGTGSTMLYTPPTFTFFSAAACGSGGGYCIGSTNMIKRDFTVSSGIGFGLKSDNSYNGCFLGVSSPGSIQNVTLYGFVIQGNAQGMCSSGGATWLVNDDIYGFSGNTNNPACTGLLDSATGGFVINMYITTSCTESPGSVMQLANSETVQYAFGSTGGTAGGNILVSSSNALVYLNNIQVGLGITVSTNAKAWINDAYQVLGGGDTCRINVLSGSTVYIRGSQINNTTASGTHYAACVDGTSTLIDGGANLFTAFTSAFNITAGGIVIPNPTSSYTGNGLSGTFTPTGTGPCATITTSTGNIYGGSFKCTGTTGAATITLTLPSSFNGNGYKCDFKDITTTADTITPTNAGATTCTASGSSIAANDVIAFSAQPF